MQYLAFSGQSTPLATSALGSNVDYRNAGKVVNRLLSDLGRGKADDTWEKRLRRYLKPELLIIDDFALKEFTKTQAEDLYELIDRRYRSGSMIVTANRSPEDWYPLFPNPVIAESALDRLINCSHIITLTGKSYRALLRPNQSLVKEVITV